MTQTNQALDFQQIIASVRHTAEKYVSTGKVRFNPDSKVVERIIRSLAMNKLRHGRAFCP